MVVMTGSLPLIMRVMIMVQAQASAETIGKNAAGWNALEPGRRMISTPINPTAVASQRRTPTLSARNTIESAVTNSGETKPVAEASAIGRNRKPEMKNSEDASSATPRISCRPRRSVRNAYSGEPGSIAGDMISANARNLIQAISIEGSVAERYFAVTSEAPRNTVDARISAMPRNGRSARAGAVRTAGFFSGRGNGVLSSLAAAAGGGVKAELRREIIESSEPLKTIIGVTRQGPKTGSRYARLHAAATFTRLIPAQRLRRCRWRSRAKRGVSKDVGTSALMVRDGARAPPHHEEPTASAGP